MAYCHADNYDTFGFSGVLTLDGNFGRITKIRIQHLLCFLEYYGREVDGDFGYHSQLALQKWLRRRGFYPSSKYRLDGDAGNSTWNEFYRYLRWLSSNYYFGTQGGEEGHANVMACQAWLNHLDGRLKYPQSYYIKPGETASQAMRRTWGI
ncbi:peptidoglycan-binding domain-containing protein [Glutamicibacter arilaitensis]|uniref:peptidoglycan-binding domain-containing protein n=1 Tax=Glutamicibacter arilaitensis TaxID=256701 RepID=UPI003FD1D581